MGKGYYGAEYVKTKNGDYDYQGQVNRLHNLRQWDRDETLAVAPQSNISLDEMQERWNAYDWLVADSKHWEADVIRKVDEDAWKKRQAAKRKHVSTATFNIGLISKFIH